LVFFTQSWQQGQGTVVCRHINVTSLACIAFDTDNHSL
jgi:hypothetical protein